MLIGTAAAYDIPGTLVFSILIAAEISSAGVGIPIPGICYARTRSYLVFVHTCVPGRL